MTTTNHLTGSYTCTKPMLSLNSIYINEKLQDKYNDVT